MKRITVSLPNHDADALVRTARRYGISVSAFVRKALQEQMSTPTGSDSLPFVALGRSEGKTTAQDAEDILAREWRHR
jgi:Arc/MetJ-type ribon-helix-helix transcriptional regulator